MRSGRSLALVATLLVTACAARAPGNAPRMLGMRDAGKHTTVTLGEFVTIVMPLDGGGGSAWLIEAVDQTVLGQRGEAQTGPDGRTMLFEFVAKGRGTTDVKLVYRRGADPPSRTFATTIVVR